MTKNKQIKLSLIIPAYREEAVLDATLTEVQAYLRSKRLLASSEVIVVAADGGDATIQIAKRHVENFPNFIVVEPGKRVGKGRDVRLGMMTATGEYRIFTDADLATPLHHIEPMLELLEVGHELAIGVRKIDAVHEGFMRRWSSRASNALIQLLVVPGIKDTQCGFKGFKADAAERLFSQITILGWGFDFEILACARRFNYRIGSIDIDDWSDPKGDHGLVGDSQLSAMLKTLRELFKVRLNLWRGLYK